MERSDLRWAGVSMDRREWPKQPVVACVQRLESTKLLQWRSTRRLEKRELDRANVRSVAGVVYLQNRNIDGCTPLFYRDGGNAV